MNIAGPFIRRSVMTTLVMLSILLFGVMAYRQLPVSDLPNVDFPTIQVSARVPGASPEMVVLVPDPPVVWPPGVRVIVQSPVAGRLFSTTLPVGNTQVG